MNDAQWFDDAFSRDLPMLRAQGEGQEMEFKREFPQQASDLAKEIAAFATSNTGTILLGVEDNGDLVGLAGVGNAEERDTLLRRLEGICSGSIKPAVTPRVTWAMENDCVVLAITVSKGSEPIYYSQGKPYLRHITTSRPAEPHEVVALICDYLSHRLGPSAENDDEETSFFSELSAILNRILVWAETPAEQRMLNPWLEEWRSDYEAEARHLRELAATDIAVRKGIDERIHDVARALDEVASFRLTLGCGDKLESKASHARDMTFSLKTETVDHIPLSEESLRLVRNAIREASRKVAALAERAQEMADSGRIEELQSEVGSVGNQLMQLSFYDLDTIGPDAAHSVREIGLAMRLLEVARIYMDGGKSIQRIVDEVGDCSRRLEELVERIGNGPT
ncbi:AlbA family DNA-binding domain-containing protein [Halomonas stenophila]|uniref:Schlafen AlbA-2 domain-containing protein n=1 Tax=Halomonas stenophila TaxID=795312 RepID=A0A7W5EU71_9GAMM|nr:ATP-binding protein [Halomonas stenophila]MBB3231142.1 hypothetical protein [Halomonas stenophila]